MTERKSPSDLSMKIRFAIFIAASIFWFYTVIFAHGLLYATGLLFYIFGVLIFLVPIWREIW